MDAVNQVPVGVVHFVERLVTQNTGIVDHHIDPTEGIEGVLNQFVAVGDRVVVGLGGAAGLADFRHHAISRRSVGAFALGRAAEVVDQDFRALFGEQQCMRPSQAATCTGDDHNFIFEAHRFIHVGKLQQARDIALECRARGCGSQ
ncbi:hypothetical protein D3C87_1741880 [compost metagenome]